ncbi:hypothetical protein MOQ67_25190 [Pseudomonas sp. LY-1]|uniref:hypothetical protein n=1 Tax=Pseudomonas marginalis TaxID=298 RepID=UPI00209E1E56|nr:hypothetical protein [Pseudomonas marginalis]MCP1508514.1 hypothetical protein [Pseudomonas marginalis]MCP1526018.1 hypothetical protein [Pseudomonas marginalis]MDQ0498668.1 hypothetical protein [Pseudomonas marginalis]
MPYHSKSSAVRKEIAGGGRYACIAQEETKRFVLLQKPYATETLALLLQKVVKGRLGRSLGEE